MKSFFKELFEYNHQYNQKLYDQFKEHQISVKPLRLFNHILNAHHIWNNRIESKDPAFSPWDLHLLYDLKDMDQSNFEQSLLILEDFDLEDMIHYTKGEAFDNSVRDILFHIINHSTYHRGQIAASFRVHGLEPLVSDYIFYRR
ncbi:MAG: DinB family protein [Ginsengibacter sp.]